LYLEKNDYVNAADFLKKAIESYGNGTVLYKLDRTYTNEGWKNIFVNSENGAIENISVVPFNFNESQPNPLTKWMLATDMFMVKPTSAVVDSFKTQMQLTNTIGDLARGIKVTYDTTSTGEAYISKYAIDKGEPYSSDIIISRAADLHLLLAEALNRMGDSKTALIILNAGFNAESVKPAPYFRWSSSLGVRGRAYLQPKLAPDSINGAPITPIALTEYVEDLIIQERALELAFEGKRWFDLVRVAKRRGPQYLANKVAAKFSDSAKAQEIRTKLMNESNWYLPYKK
jgi:starch-binding outer membrane protein, SusD/RagB family